MSQQKFCLNKYSARNILLSSSGVVLTLLGVLTLLPPTTPKDTSAVIDPETYDLYLSASPVEITAGKKGDAALGKSTITSTTLSPAGYELYLSMTSDSNAVRMGNTNSIAATSGTFETPMPLADSSASWGYAIAGLNNFDVSYDNASESSKFAAVPTVANPQLIHNHSGASPDGSELDVYFGVKATKNTPSGQYTADIMISSISDMTSEPHKEAEVTEGGELEEGYSNAVAAVRTSLKATSITFAPSDLIVKIDGKVCNNVAITEQIPLSITASVPNGLPEGEYDVEISIPKIGRTYVVEKGIKVTAPAIPKTAKAILGTNGNLNFVYDTKTYIAGETYTDNLGETTIKGWYAVPVNNRGSAPSWNTANNKRVITSANFDESFYGFEPTSTERWFSLTDSSLGKITNGQNLNTSKVTSMAYMFSYTGYVAPYFIAEGIDEWDTSNVTDMSYMFSWANYGSNGSTWSVGDLGKWDVSNVTDMNNMFRQAGCASGTPYSWTPGDLSKWDVSSVTNTESMFEGAGQFANEWSIGDIGGWDVSSVTNMSKMFQNIGSSVSEGIIGNLGGWDVSSATDMSNMFCDSFANATSWSVGDLREWDVSSVTNMSSMFARAGGSSTANMPVGDLGGWDVSSVTNMSNMFANFAYNAEAWSAGNLSGWDVSSVTDMSNMFNDTGHNSATWDAAYVIDWNTNNVTNMSYMFRRAGYSVQNFSLNLNGLETGSVTNMSTMFNQACTNSQSCTIDFDEWDTSSVTNMSNMFSYIGTKVTGNFDISGVVNWDTGSVTSMQMMFYQAAPNATYSLNLSGWNVDNVIGLMAYMNFNSGVTGKITQPKWKN